MVIRKHYLLFILLFPFFAFDTDCMEDFECLPVKNKSGNEYSIEMKLKNGSSQVYTFELYDLNTGTSINEKKVVFSKGEIKMVFEKVKPSTYSVYYSSENCRKKPLKGMGIILN